VKRFLFIIALYALLALAATHPLWQHLGDALPGDVGDPVLNAYILAWDVHALVVDPMHLFDANIFFPLPGTLAYSENLSGSALLALPLMLLSGEPVLTYNLVFLSSFVLAGAGMYLLVLHITRRRVAAFAAGVAFAFAPYHIASLAHLQLLTIGWLPLLVLALSRLLVALHSAPRRAAAVLFFVFLEMQIASTLHGALFAVLSVLGFCGLHARRLGMLTRRDADSGRAHAGAAGRKPAARREFVVPLVVFACLLLPLSVPYLVVLNELSASRPPDVALSFSAQPTDYLAAYPDNRFDAALSASFRARAGFSEEQTLFMGIVTPLLALAALAGRGSSPFGPSGERPPSATPKGMAPGTAMPEAGSRELAGVGKQQARLRSWTVFFVGLALASLLLAASGALAQTLPLAGIMRVPARWSAVLTFALAGLAGIGSARLVNRFTRAASNYLHPPLLRRQRLNAPELPSPPAPLPKAERGVGALIAGACLAALLYVEGFAAPIALADVGTLRGQHAVYYYLAQLPGREAVLELPMYTGTKRESVESKRMYASVVHWRPLVNGYSGVTPKRQLALADQLKDFPDDTSIAALRALGQQGVRYVIVHAGERGIPRPEWNQTNRARALATGVLKLVRTFDDNDLMEISSP